jgi:hypothetical protein
MTTKYAPNYSIDVTTANNSFSAVWKFTRTLKAAGWTYKASGDGTNKDTTGTATNDKWGGAADPTTDLYSSVQSQLDTRAAWWCAEGPSTVKLGIGAASSGTFIRGEVVTQTTSGATGEIIGYVLNAAGNSGWVVIMPHTGTFNGADVITGGTSGATVTATSYALFRRQIVVAKNTTVTAGWIFYECLTQAEIDASANTALFYDLAANAANCTATTAPGNSSSGSNRFPSYAIAVIGQSESTGNAFFGVTTGFGKAHMAATNATPSAGVSADGSAFVAIWNTTNAAYCPISIQRLDDSEPGDCDPYIVCTPTTEVATASTGRTAGTTPSAAYTFDRIVGTRAGTPAKGYCARGTGTMGVAPDAYVGFVMGGAQQAGASDTGSTGIYAQAANAASATKIRNHPDAAGTPPYPIEQVNVTSTATGLTMRKGVCRHLALLPAGSINDTADAKLWLVISAINGVATPALAIGPLDGSTTPTTT